MAAYLWEQVTSLKLCQVLISCQPRLAPYYKARVKGVRQARENATAGCRRSIKRTGFRGRCNTADEQRSPACVDTAPAQLWWSNQCMIIIRCPVQQGLEEHADLADSQEKPDARPPWRLWVFMEGDVFE